ncbi:hypothetical protein B0H17DRAFT_1200569 [Mycena rosella]|uniref:Uncharacterized protein n=1 Tax=Mycena rosella TaxID=1033263 RepID=A0AAD7GFH1_MYCRO|nr:hypothetical protein B0H17DRAFT_1200569 [Mycena rosella]
MRTVQKSFQIPAYGENHTVPDMTAEIQKLADALRDEKIQEYVVNRPANDPSDSTATTPVRDLLEEGSKYADTRAAFKKFTREMRKAQNMGFVDAEEDDKLDPESEEEDNSETMEEEYEAMEGDLGLDEKEPYADASSLLAIASDLISDSL